MRFFARAALIDLDGTLVDSLPDIASATNAMRDDLGYRPLPAHVIAQYVGKGVDVLIHRALTESMSEVADADLFARGQHAFNCHYARVNGDQSRVFDGVPQALEDLRQKKIVLACVTNKPRQFTLQLLERSGLRSSFAAIVSGDDIEQKKPHAQPVLRACEMLGVSAAEAIVIGDSENDALSARAAGCSVIMVETGYNEGRSISDVDADVIVASLLDAAQLIESQSR